MKTPLSKLATLQVEAEFDLLDTSKIIPYIKIPGRWLEDFGFYLDGKITLTAQYGLLIIEVEQQKIS